MINDALAPPESNSTVTAPVKSKTPGVGNDVHCTGSGFPCKSVPPLQTRPPTCVPRSTEVPKTSNEASAKVPCRHQWSPGLKPVSSTKKSTVPIGDAKQARAAHTHIANAAEILVTFRIACPPES